MVVLKAAVTAAHLAALMAESLAARTVAWTAAKMVDPMVGTWADKRAVHWVVHLAAKKVA